MKLRHVIMLMVELIGGVGIGPADPPVLAKVFLDENRAGHATNERIPPQFCGGTE
jgi:hypothetical protein